MKLFHRQGIPNRPNVSRDLYRKTEQTNLCCGISNTHRNLVENTSNNYGSLPNRDNFAKYEKCLINLMMIFRLVANCGYVKTC